MGTVGVPLRQVAVSRSEEDPTLGEQEVEGQGNNYVHGEGTGPDQHQVLIPANSSRHLSPEQDEIFGDCQLPELRGTLLSERRR